MSLTPNKAEGSCELYVYKFNFKKSTFNLIKIIEFVLICKK